jgi:hypothetical protein
MPGSQREEQIDPAGVIEDLGIIESGERTRGYRESSQAVRHSARAAEPDCRREDEQERGLALPALGLYLPRTVNLTFVAIDCLTNAENR